MDTSESSTLTFEFITDPQFRESLEGDHTELNSCIEARAWKSALVASGSIVEAVLADYLLSTGQKKPDPLRMDLGALIDACQAAGVLTRRTAELSSVIRSYRNLIHPGRVVRLGEQFGPDDAQVAVHVVRIIVKEVAARQAQEFGLTAGQLVSKFETDHNAPAITALLLGDLRPEELRRLVLEVLPNRYFEAGDLDATDANTPAMLDRLKALYRAALDAGDDDLRKAATKRYVTVLREGSGRRVEEYGDAFFRGFDLRYLPKKDRDLVVAHVLGRLSVRASTTDAFLRSAVGLSPYLSAQQLVEYFNGFIQVIAYEPTPRERVAADALTAEYFEHTSSEQDEVLRGHLQRWVEFLRDRDRYEEAEAVERVLAVVGISDEDIPF